MVHPIVVPSSSTSTSVAVPGTRDAASVAVPGDARGGRGPQGIPGIILVQHGSDPTVPRPDTDSIVLWRGSVQPNNWDTTQDLWLLDNS